MSTTAKMLKSIKEILNTNNKGLTATQLWQELEKDKSLKKEMYTVDGSKRLGLLNGILNRVKAQKISNVYYNVNNKCFYYIANDLSLINTITNNYINDVSNLVNNLDFGSLTNQGNKAVKEFYEQINKIKEKQEKLPKDMELVKRK